MTEPKRLLVLTDRPFLQTGYATIMNNILNYLTTKGWECHSLSHGYKGQTLVPGTQVSNGMKLNFWIHGSSIEPYAKELLEYYIKTIKPDIFLILLDTFMLYPWLLDKDLSPSLPVFYFPSDGGEGLPTGCDKILKKMSRAVAMSKFGQKQVLQYHGIKADYIPHAVETSNYFPLPQAKRDEIKAVSGLAGKFVVGCVARNQPRKQMDRTLKAFKRFAQGKDDVVLLLHTDPYDAARNFDMKTKIQQWGIQNKVLFTGMHWWNGFDYKKMNDVYNVMDVFFMLTTGEGFGVPIIEAQAAGIPQVVTDYTTTQELVLEDGQSGLGVRLVDCAEDEWNALDKWDLKQIDSYLNDVGGTVTGGYEVERGLASIRHAAEQLEKLYRHKELREQFAQAGVEKVKKLYNWDLVIEQWHKLFTEMVEKR